MKCACGKTISENKVACRGCIETASAKAAAGPSPTGCLEVLNVAAGDLKITFDKANPIETIRAKRIITDMLRRGYALVVEVERDGKVAYERAQSFDEKTGEYIVADFDSLRAAKVDSAEPAPPTEPLTVTLKGRTQDPNDPEKCSCGAKWRHQGTCKGSKRQTYSRLPMETTKATGIGRSAGG